MVRFFIGWLFFYGLRPYLDIVSEMAKGNKKLNPYFLYMQEQRKLRPEWAKLTNVELMEKCDAGWRSLTEIEQQKYRDKSQTCEASTGRKKGEVRLGANDALGRPLAEIRRRDSEKKAEEDERRRLPSCIVENAMKSNNLKEAQFVVMSSSVFAFSESLPPVCVPAELAVVRFSLNAGIETALQAFLQPGSIPTGYSFQCREAEKQHMVPLDGLDIETHHQIGMEEPVEFRRSEDIEVCRKFAEFLYNCQEVFFLPGREQQDKAVVSLIHSRGGLPVPRLVWLPLPQLLAALHPDLSPAMAEVELQKERFLYSEGLACNWHQTRTDTIHCSQAVVRRNVFCLLELVSPYHNLKLLPGYHVPHEREMCTENKDWDWEPPNKIVTIGKMRDDNGTFGSTDMRYRDSEGTADMRYVNREESWNMRYRDGEGFSDMKYGVSEGSMDMSYRNSLGSSDMRYMDSEGSLDMRNGDSEEESDNKEKTTVGRGRGRVILASNLVRKEEDSVRDIIELLGPRKDVKITMERGVRRTDLDKGRLELGEEKLELDEETINMHEETNDTDTEEMTGDRGSMLMKSTTELYNRKNTQGALVTSGRGRVPLSLGKICVSEGSGIVSNMESDNCKELDISNMTTIEAKVRADKIFGKNVSLAENEMDVLRKEISSMYEEEGSDWKEVYLGEEVGPMGKDGQVKEVVPSMKETAEEKEAGKVPSSVLRKNSFDFSNMKLLLESNGGVMTLEPGQVEGRSFVPKGRAKQVRKNILYNF